MCGAGDDTAIAITATDADGFYLFADLPAGDYCVRFVAPEGYFFTAQNVGADDALESDVDPETGFTDCINLEPGETDLTIDAWLFQPPTGGQGCTPIYWKQEHHFDSWESPLAPKEKVVLLQGARIRRSLKIRRPKEQKVFKQNLICVFDFSSTLQPASYCFSKSLPPIHKGAELYCIWR